MRPILTNTASLRAFLAGHNLTPNRGESQNFLVCVEVLEAILLALDSEVRQVTELGAGVGTLTGALAAAGWRVRAIEKDTQLADILPNTLSPAQRSQVEVIAADMREVEWGWDNQAENKPTRRLAPSEHYRGAERGQGRGGNGYQLVGNIPYHLSGLIIRRITQLDPPPVRVILLTQREVGQRLCAAPPDMQLLALAVQLWGTPHRLLRVPASCFWPQPKVESQLTLLEPHADVQQQLRQNEMILKFSKPLWQGRRKQLLGQMTRSFQLPRPRIESLLQQIGVPPTARPQELTVAQWRTLADLTGPSLTKDSP